MADPNIELLTRVVQVLGGCATALLITDPAASPVRATQDVDAVVAVVSLAEYHQLGAALRARGFSQSIEEGEPPYRWTLGGLKLDLMPSDAAVLGFTNRWYTAVLSSAFTVSVGEDITIRLANAPSFLATKLEAFLDRGKGDYLLSHDLEDVLSVVDGRPGLVDELRAADTDLRTFVGTTFADLLAEEGFRNALPGLVLEGSPAVRTPIVLLRLRQIAELRN